jgi:hypothetical protein
MLAVSLAGIGRWLLTSRIGQALLLALVVAAGLMGIRLKSVRDGVERERAAQAERNRKTKEMADAARADALAADDPRRELLRDFGRPNGR